MTADEKANPRAGQGVGVLAELRTGRNPRRYGEFYTSNGLSVLPLVEGKKTPATLHGVKDATLDASALSWLDRCNVGIAPGPAGLLVVDIDPRNGGIATFAELERTLGELPLTVAAVTGGGGLHLLFVAPDGPLVGKLGAGVDMISDGRYIVVEPSYVAPAPDAPAIELPPGHPGRGFYRWRPGLAPGDIAFAELPLAWRDRVRRQAPATALATAPATAPRSASRGDVFERARRYVERMPPAVSGSGGHAATFAVAQVLTRGFDLDDGDARAILDEYNARCEPPWNDRELEHKLRSARASGTMLVGSLRDAPLPDRPRRIDEPPAWDDIPPPEPPPSLADLEPEREPVEVIGPGATPAEEFSPEPVRVDADEASPVRGPWFLPGREWLSTPPPVAPWILDGLIPRGLPSLLAGPPKAGKTTLALDLAIAVATGGSALGGRCANGLGRPAGVGLITVEDQRAQLAETVRQLLAGRGITDSSTFAANLHAWNERDGLRLPRDFARLADELVRLKIEVLFIDPLAAVFEGDENSTADATAFVDGWTAACRKSGAGIAVLAHEGKTPAGAPTRDAVNAPRGSSAFAGGARHIVRLRRGKGGTITVSTAGNLGPAESFKVRDVRTDGTIRYELIGNDDESHEGGDPAGDTDTADRDAKVIELHKQRVTYRDIERATGVSKSEVGRIVKAAGLSR